MCTVTFVPQVDSGFVLTSNRDEAPARKTLMPDFYEVNGSRLYFPKDEIAGGTWIGASSQKRVVCLLNGGFEPHIRKSEYRMSRGVIVTQLLTSENATQTISTLDLEGIEPFTLIAADWSTNLELLELVWDGNDSHFSKKPMEPTIWSSSLLYTSEMKQKREDWFGKLLEDIHQPDEYALLNFHKQAGEGSSEYDLIMDRGFVKTRSISQVKKQPNRTLFRYEDLLINEISTKEL
ncbi:MAG: hypothetical protein HKN48_13820 [Flavobacteriaceae bacterium]|nr:hypothetical protein [Flavobacteriaceae bacterium]